MLGPARQPNKTLECRFTPARLTKAALGAIGAPSACLISSIAAFSASPTPPLALRHALASEITKSGSRRARRR